MSHSPLQYTHMDSPIGPLLLVGTDKSLHYISFPVGKTTFGPKPEWQQADAPFKEVIRQLNAYFQGELKQFQLPLELAGTSFQKKVWQTLPKIPYGQIRTYGWLANEVGSPKASRAIGAANGANPIPIILPCHRVIGANGALTGFGGGLPIKKFLLELEGYKIQGAQLRMF